MAEWVKKEGYETKLLADERDLNLKGTQMQLVRFTKGKHEHYHERKTEIYYFLKGKGKVIIDGSKKKITPGSFFMIKPNARHIFLNEGKGPLEAIMLKTNNSPADTYQD